MREYRYTSNLDSKLTSGLFTLTAMILWLSVSLSIIREGVYTEGAFYIFCGAATFLILTLLVKWRKMNSPVGVTWRRILLAGTVIVSTTAIAIKTKNLHEAAYAASILFWLAVPGYGFKIIADFRDGDTSLFILLSHLSSFLTLFFILGTITESTGIKAISTTGAGVAHAAASYKYSTN